MLLIQPKYHLTIKMLKEIIIGLNLSIKLLINLMLDIVNLVHF